VVAASEMATGVVVGSGHDPGARVGARSLIAGNGLPPDVSDPQPGHLDRPLAGIHDPRRGRRELVEHQAAQYLDSEAMREKA
jgi:hypothetical protein